MAKERTKSAAQIACQAFRRRGDLPISKVQTSTRDNISPLGKKILEVLEEHSQKNPMAVAGIVMNKKKIAQKIGQFENQEGKTLSFKVGYEVEVLDNLGLVEAKTVKNIHIDYAITEAGLQKLAELKAQEPTTTPPEGTKPSEP